MLAATAAKSLSVVLTLRGDFVGHALAYRPLSDRLQDAQVNLGPMHRDELQLAIEQPALKVEARFEPGLIKTILDDVGEEPGNLPLLAFVLQQLWDDAILHGNTLRHRAYEAMGGVAGALAQTAEGVYGALSDIEKHAARQVFLQLVRPAPTGEDTRRRATFSELGQGTRTLIKQLADARLVVTNREDGTKEETVEVAHEVLLRHWGQLKSWLNEDREFLLWRERLRGARDAWLRAEQDRDALLRGALLSEAERWLAQRSELSEDERAYIATSVTARSKAQRKTRRLTVATVAVALTAAAAFAFLAVSAREQKALADKRLVDAQSVAERIVLSIEEELKPVAGTASLRRKLLGEANELLERLSQDAASDPNTMHTSLWGRIQRGDLARSHDDLAQARHLYDEARVIAERLAQADPSNSQWQRDLSISYERLGDVEVAAGKLDAARTAYAQSLTIRERLAQADPSNNEWQWESAASYSRLGDVEVVAEKLDTARAAYSQSLAITERLAQADPSNSQWQRDLSVSYNKLGDVERAAGKLDAARTAYAQSLTIFERLAQADPSNSQWQRDLSVSYDKLGDVERAAGKLDAARTAYAQSLTIRERLAQADPSNSEWQRDLSVSYHRVARAAQAQNNLIDASKGFKKYLEIMTRLVTADPNNAGWKKDVLMGYEALLETLPVKNCDVDNYLAAAERVLTWFDQTKALDGDAQMPGIRDFFRQYRAERGDGPCREEKER